MIYKIKFLFILTLILVTAPAGLSALAQDRTPARLTTTFTGEEVDDSQFRGVPSISIGEIAVNDPTLIRNPLEISAVWQTSKPSGTTIFGFDVSVEVKLKDGRIFREKKSVGATETQVKFAISIPAATAAPSGGVAAPANTRQDQKSSGPSAQRSGAGTSSSGARAGNGARRTAAGESGRIVPNIAVESVSLQVIANFSMPLFTRESRQKSFKF